MIRLQGIFNKPIVSSVLAGLCIVMALWAGTDDLLGQRKRSSTAKQVDLDALWADAQAKYQLYQFADARRSLEQYSTASKKARKAIHQEVDELLQRVDKAERLAELSESVELIDSLHTTFGDLGLDLERLLTNPETRTNWVGSFRTEMRPDSSLFYSYTTQLRRIRLESLSNETSGAMMRYERIAGKYQPIAGALEALTEGHNRHICPFLMSDGVRILFAREDPSGLGGYDLYISRYRVEEDTYYKPTQLGMPFNSPYNDYLLIYDESNDRSLLVSDRFCPEGTIAIYRFKGAPRVLGGAGIAQSGTSTQAESALDNAALSRASLHGLPIPSARGYVPAAPTTQELINQETNNQ
ncbi:hypothetical protein [Porphyromonas sp. COT-290 OH3588]|uniref:hypothetical protein n=1 Tax=Porphyromonas sp. COT-290 OH3588 TaxID=1515617 RepID=UPI00126A06C9|nr:hypothetical protein [Porphyromonas sp. COT-290 OH3588]